MKERGTLNIFRYKQIYINKKARSCGLFYNFQYGKSAIGTDRYNHIINSISVDKALAAWLRRYAVYNLG